MFRTFTPALLLALVACGSESELHSIETQPFVPFPGEQSETITVPTTFGAANESRCSFPIEDRYGRTLTVQNYPTFTLVGPSEIEARVGDNIRMQIEVNSVPGCGPLEINTMDFWVTDGPAEYIDWENIIWIDSETLPGIAELNGSTYDLDNFWDAVMDVGDDWPYDNPWIQTYAWTDGTVIPAENGNNLMPTQRLEDGETLTLEFMWRPGYDNAPVGTTLTVLPMELDWSDSRGVWIYADTSEIFSDLSLTVHIVE